MLIKGGKSADLKKKSQVRQCLVVGHECAHVATKNRMTARHEMKQNGEHQDTRKIFVGKLEYLYFMKVIITTDCSKRVNLCSS